MKTLLLSNYETYSIISKLGSEEVINGGNDNCFGW